MSLNRLKKHSQNHSFSVQLAMDLGVNAAIVYNHLHYWINHNRISGLAQAEGKTWTYQTRQTMQEYLPYLTEKEVRGAIDSLVEFGYVIKGKFNRNKFDQTTWYSLPDSEPCLPGREENSNNVFEDDKRANGMAPPVQSKESERANASIYKKDMKEDKKSTSSDDDDRVREASEITLSDVHFNCVRLKKNWLPDEIDKAFEAYKKYSANVENPLEYIESIIEKNRVTKQNTTIKKDMEKSCSTTKQEVIETLQERQARAAQKLSESGTDLSILETYLQQDKERYNRKFCIS